MERFKNFRVTGMFIDNGVYAFAEPGRPRCSKPSRFPRVGVIQIRASMLARIAAERWADDKETT
jgi:hypothetical protein